MKYDFDLSLDENASVGKIIAQISDNASVLEFGPGNGRMTSYLVSEKKCDVSIVEFDEELYKTVMQFANDGFLGNIEDYQWTAYFSGKAFDYIVFADVLEHLTNSEEVLKVSTGFLKDSGRILITFPNLAHNSVLIGLFNNELDWNEYGLLDRTHNTFFTQHGFEGVFERAGLNIAIEDFTYSQVGQNEINASYDQLPIPSRYDFKTRLFGEVYQYFYALAKETVLEPVRKVPENSNFVKPIIMTYHFGEDKDTGAFLFNNSTGENKATTHEIGENVTGLTIRPLEGSGILYFKATADNEEILPEKSNFVAVENNIYLFSGKEKPAFFDFTEEQISGKELKLDVDIISENQFYDIEELALLQANKNKQLLKKAKMTEQTLVREKEAQKELMQTRAKAFSSMTKHDPFLKIQLAKMRLMEYSYYSKKELKDVQINIEQVTTEDDESRTIIQGWGYSAGSLEPLHYACPALQGSYFNVTPTFRQDVIDSFDLKEKKKYGFNIVIEDFLADKIFLLDVSDTQEQCWKLKFNRFNLDNTPVTSRARRVLGAIRRNGIRKSLSNWHARRNSQTSYDVWIEQHENYHLEELKKESAAFSYQPKISIAVPVYNVEEKWLTACVGSLKNQAYPNWELCIADDCSTEEHIKPMLEKFASEDERIKILFREQNGHISEATNSAIGLATGEYIGFMDNDDELAPNALFEVVKALNNDRTIDFIYTDEDKVTVRGQRFDPFFKPDWNEELLLGHNYITHFVVVKKEIVTHEAGGLRHEYNGSQDYDFVLRATEVAKNICHIPKILYHWRTIETSTALDPQSKEYAYVAGKNAVKAALDRRGIDADVEMTKNYGAYKVSYQYNTHPLVSIIPVGKEENIGTWTENLLNSTYYQNFEILLPDKFKTAVGEADKRIRYVLAASVNEMAKEAKGSYLVFLNEFLMPKNNEWLDEMRRLVQKENTGIATGKIISKDEIVLNIGLTLNQAENRVEFEQKGASNKTIGYYFRPVLPREIYAATADFIIISRKDFETAGGFDTSLPSDLRGIDLSVKVRNQTGQKILFQPYAEMFLTQENAFCAPIPMDTLEQKYTEAELDDPYTNSNLFLI